MPDTNPPASNFTPLPDESIAGAATTASVATTAQSTTTTTSSTISQADIDRLGIPFEWVNRDPELISLVLKSESMKDEERKYWFQLLPVMTDEQIGKLRGILDNERKQLAALDAKYEDDVKKLNEKHLAEWKIEEDRKKRQAIEQKEQAAKSADEQAQEDILKQIENS